MKIDMHCHVKEGSIDSKVGLDEYITKLKEHGFEGMLITDHDTYKGYRHWKYHMKGKVHEDFVVLKGLNMIPATQGILSALCRKVLRCACWRCAACRSVR